MLRQLSRTYYRTQYSCNFEYSWFSKMIEQNEKKKRNKQFSQEINYLANKPTFQLIDYKIRLQEKRDKLSKGIRNFFSSTIREQRNKLGNQLKISKALYHDELIGQTKITSHTKKNISLITENPLEQVAKFFNEFQKYQQIHTVLRLMYQNGEQLPKNQDELMKACMQSGIQNRGIKGRYLKYKKHSRKQLEKLERKLNKKKEF